MREQEDAAWAAPWHERGRMLAQRISGLIDSGAGSAAHPVEIELYDLLRRHGGARDAAASAYAIGRHHQQAGDYSGAVAAFRDARAMFLELGEIESLAAADLGIALMHASSRRLDLALGALHESAGQLLRLGAPPAAARAHVSAATFLMLGHRYAEAEPELDTADRLLGTFASRVASGAVSSAAESALVFVAAITRVRLTVLTGRIADAVDALARAQFAAAEDPLYLGFVLDQQAQLALLRADRAVHAAALERAAMLFLAGGAPQLAAVELARLGLTLESRGEPARARDLLTQSADLLRSPPPDPARSPEVRVSPYLVVADLELDRETSARLARWGRSPG
jgi:hypothetical protein